MSLAVLGGLMYRWSVLGVHVPSVLGRTVPAAQQLTVPLQLGLAVTSQRQDPRAGVGVILSQTPPPGRDVVKGSVIQLVVSQGSGIVPELRGIPAAQAEQRLRAGGLRLGHVSYGYADRITSGAVVSQSSASGARLAPDASVDVMVSQGPHQPAPPMSTAQAGGAEGSGIAPDLRGIPLSQAELRLRAAGLRMGRVSYTYDDRAASGTVIHQWSDPGTLLAPNASVDVLVSQGSPPSSTPEPVPIPQPVPTPQPSTLGDTGN